MFALDLFNNDHERRLAEGAVDQLEQRRIDDLAMKMDDLVARAKQATTPEVKAALVKEFKKCKAERDSYYKISNETMGYGTLVGEDTEEDWYDANGRPDEYGCYDAGGHYHAEREEDIDAGYDAYKEREWTSEAGIPGSVPTEKIPGKEDLLKGRGRSYYEGQNQTNLRDNVLAVLENIYNGSMAGEYMIDDIADELNDYFDQVQQSNDPILQQAYSFMVNNGQEAEDNPKLMARIAKKAISMLSQQNTLNEYIVRSGDDISSVMSLNLFNDLLSDAKLSDYDEEFANSPEWQAVVANWAPKAEYLQKEIYKYQNTGRKLRDAEADAIDATAYDGSDAYEDAETAASYLPKIYARQAAAIVRLLKDGYANPDSTMHEDDGRIVSQNPAPPPPTPEQEFKYHAFQVRRKKQDLLKRFATGGAIVEIEWALEHSVFMTKEQMLDYLDHTIEDPELEPIEYMHNKGFTSDSMIKGLFKRLVGLGLSKSQILGIIKNGDQGKPASPSLISRVAGQALRTEMNEDQTFVPAVGDEIMWRPKNAKMMPTPVTVVAVSPDKLTIKLQSPGMIQRSGKDTMIVSIANSDISTKPTAGIPGSVPTEKIPGKEALLKGQGRSYYEDEDQKKNSKEVNEDQRLAVGDPVIVTAPNEFEGKTGEIRELSPSGKFVIVDLYNHGKHSMHSSDVAYNQYADDQEEDDWYDEEEMDEGFQDFNKVEPYAVCLAGKPVKKFDYYEDARRFHDNWKKKLYREGNKDKADKITLMPLDLDEVYTPAPAKPFRNPPGFNKKRTAIGNRFADLNRAELANIQPSKGTPVPAKSFAQGIEKDLQKAMAKPKIQVKKNKGVAEGGAETSWSNDTGTITLQDILELTKHIKQINLPINDNLKSKLIHWEGNPEEIERVNQVTVSNQFPILIMVDEQGQIAWILDGNHRLHKAIQSQAKTIPAKLIKPSNLNDKAKKIFNIKEQGVAEGAGKQLSVQQLATISDAALDSAYGYGRSQPGNTFGWQANLKSAAFAKQMIDKGITDVESISDAIHKGWNVTAQAFVKNPMMFDDSKTMAPEKLQAKVAQRQKLMTQQYAQLPEDEKEKDRVVARAMLQAITGGQQGVTEAETDYSKRRQRERDVDAGRPVAKPRQPRMTDYQKRRAQQKKELELGESQDTSGVEQAILHRIMVAHTDLLRQFGPEKVMQAAEEVAYNVGDLDEIGTSDVSAWVHEVKRILGAE